MAVEFFPSGVGPDAWATARAAVVALGVLTVVRVLRWTGLLSTRGARKALHCLIGPVFVACWGWWHRSDRAGLWAAIVPLGVVGFFALVGTGVVRDQGTVDIMARTGMARELLVGPVEYGLVCVVVTASSFRSLFALVVLTSLFLGDAAAEVVGSAAQAASLRAKGRGLLGVAASSPFPGSATRKSLAGSAAFVLATVLGSMAMTAIGLYQGWPGLIALVASTPAAALLAVIVAGAVGGAVSEAITTSDHDNLTGPVGTAAAILASSWALGMPAFA